MNQILSLPYWDQHPFRAACYVGLGWYSMEAVYLVTKTIVVVTWRARRKTS